MYGGIEAGGTKFVCIIGTSPDDIVDLVRIEVGSPRETLGSALAFFQRATASGVHLLGLGIASFGPLELRSGHPDYGSITNTPKPGWSGTDVIGRFVEALGVPVGFDTDVNAAALAEGRWGGARAIDAWIYLTLGTGIGGGAVVDRRLVHGLGHPEMGHISIQRRPGDRFEGVCPFHGGCFEGLASGPAVEARYGRRAEALTGRERQEAVELLGYYLAAGARSLTYALAPERIVVGGGIGLMDGVVDAARAALDLQLGGYPGLPEHRAATFLVPAELGAMAGPSGSLLIAEAAAG